MKIEVAVEDNTAFFEWKDGNFPGRFTFLDRTSKMLVEVNIELFTFQRLMEQIYKKIDVLTLIGTVHPIQEEILGEAEIYEKKDSNGVK
jgi:hypothetical protein